MSAEINYSPRTDEKRELWSMKISPRLKYIAKIAAREQECSLSNFVERAIEQSLPMQWGEGLWDSDEATRFFLLAKTHHDLLTKSEQNFLKFYELHMIYTGQKINLKTFREFWNTPGIDTKHLKPELNEGGKE